MLSDPNIPASTYASSSPRTIGALSSISSGIANGLRSTDLGGRSVNESPLSGLPYRGMTDHRSSALDMQIGGTHYKDFPIQPIEFIHKNGLGFIAGNVIKYVCRYRAKGGTVDLLKARHYIDMLIEQERKDK